MLVLHGGSVAWAGCALLQVTSGEGGTQAVHASVPLAEEPWCLAWNHSVAGFTVRDCFVVRAGQLLLVSSHQPDFAAGLGHFEGRGEFRPHPRGGYLIAGIDEPVPNNRLTLRVGAPSVAHRIEVGDHATINLSERVGQRRVTLRVVDACRAGRSVMVY